MASNPQQQQQAPATPQPQGPRAQFHTAMTMVSSYIAGLKFNRTRPHHPPLAPREDLVDHLWTDILDFYFRLEQTAPYTFGLQREAYTTDFGQRRINIAMVNKIGPVVHKVLFFEGKRPLRGGSVERRPTGPGLAGVERQLLEDMLQSRDTNGRVQTMFGMAGVGLYVKVYQVRRYGNQLRPLEGGAVLHVEDDRFMRRWAQLIASGQNR